MPDDGIETLRGFDAIFLGAVGWPGVPDHVSLWGLLIPIRRAFRQYVNLRPIKVFDGVAEPAADAGRRRLRRRAGERRGRVQRDRRPDEPRLPRRDGRAGVGFHARRGEPDRGLRVRAGADAAQATSRRRRSRTGSCTRCRSGTRWSPSGRRSIPDVRVGQRAHRRAGGEVRAAAGAVRRGRGLEPVRRHTVRPRGGGGGLDRHRAVGQPGPDEGVPVDVRAGARLGARHRRARASPTRSARCGRRR